MRDILEIAGPVAFCMLLCSIPLVAMLLRHQREMAELVNNRSRLAPDHELAEIRRELAGLRDQLNRLTVQLDGRSVPAYPPEIATRV